MDLYMQYGQWISYREPSPCIWEREAWEVKTPTLCKWAAKDQMPWPHLSSPWKGTMVCEFHTIAAAAGAGRDGVEGWGAGMHMMHGDELLWYGYRLTVLWELRSSNRSPHCGNIRMGWNLSEVELTRRSLSLWVIPLKMLRYFFQGTPTRSYGNIIVKGATSVLCLLLKTCCFFLPCSVIYHLSFQPPKLEANSPFYTINFP